MHFSVPLYQHKRNIRTLLAIVRKYSVCNVPYSGSSRRLVPFLGEMVSSTVRAKVDFRSVWTPLWKGGRRVSYGPRAPRLLALSSSRTVWEASPLHEYNVSWMSCAKRSPRKSVFRLRPAVMRVWVLSLHVILTDESFRKAG